MADLSVQQGPVLYDANPGEVVSPENYQGVFIEYFFENSYENDRHTYMASQTSETPFNNSLVGFVRIGAPTTLWICEWTACQLGAKPLAPDPVPQSTGWVLLDIQPRLAGVSIATDGVSKLYRISGVYVYGQKNPNADVFQDAVFPLYPWVVDDEPRQMLNSDLKVGMTDIAGVGGAGGQNNQGQGKPPVQRG